MWNIFIDIIFWQKWPLKWIRDLWQLSYFSIYTVTDWSIDLYLYTQMYQSSLYLCLHIASRIGLIIFSRGFTWYLA